MGSTVVEYSAVYQHYKSIWREVDNNNLYRLLSHPQLKERINDKERGVTPLFLACTRKNHQIVSYLLQFGADPNTECKGVTPLYMSCLHAENESIECLLQYGANPNVLCTTRQISALHIASSKGLLSVCDMLCKYGMDVSLCSAKYGTALHIAAAKNHAFISKFLLEHHIQVNSVTEDGETALHIAARVECVEIVSQLLKRKDLNPAMKDKDGNTALHNACIFNSEITALKLIDRYPELIYIRNDSERQTALFYASDSVRRAIKKALTDQMPGFVTCVNNKAFSDMKYVIKDKTFFGHKVVIKQRCPALYREKDSSMYISDVDHEVFLALLHYIYTDAVECPHQLLPDLQKCAERFDLVRLKKACMDIKSKTSVVVPDSTFSSEMSKAINNPDHSDVTFIVEGKKFFSHKVILSQHQYFRAMFSLQLKEATQSEIRMDAIEESAFRVILAYTYTFKFEEIAPDLIVDVFQETTLLMIEGLRHQCEVHMCNYITEANACQLFHMADTYKSIFLKEECFDFIISHNWVCTTQNFHELPQELQAEVSDYIKKKSIQLKTKPPKPSKSHYSLMY